MPSELSVHAVHEHGLRMTATNGVFTLTTDYPLRADQQVAGFTPMELLLASLAACGGSVVASLLKRARQPVAGVEVNARGTRRDEHPTVFTAIAVEFVVRGPVDAAAVEQVLAEAEGHLCPVWAMLKPATSITTTYRILSGETTAEGV